MTGLAFPDTPIRGDVPLTGWRAAAGVLKGQLPDIPSEVLIRRLRDGQCVRCGQWHCCCNGAVPAMRPEDV